MKKNSIMGSFKLELEVQKIKKTAFKNQLKSSSNFIKKRLQQRCLPLNVAKYLRILFFKNICEQLLLNGKR